MEGKLRRIISYEEDFMVSIVSKMDVFASSTSDMNKQVKTSAMLIKLMAALIFNLRLCLQGRALAENLRIKRYEVGQTAVEDYFRKGILGNLVFHEKLRQFSSRLGETLKKLGSRWYTLNNNERVSRAIKINNLQTRLGETWTQIQSMAKLQRLLLHCVMADWDLEKSRYNELINGNIQKIQGLFSVISMFHDNLNSLIQTQRTQNVLWKLHKVCDAEAVLNRIQDSVTLKRRLSVQDASSTRAVATIQHQQRKTILLRRWLLSTICHSLACRQKDFSSFFQAIRHYKQEIKALEARRNFEQDKVTHLATLISQSSPVVKHHQCGRIKNLFEISLRISNASKILENICGKVASQKALKHIKIAANQERHANKFLLKRIEELRQHTEVSKEKMARIKLSLELGIQLVPKAAQQEQLSQVALNLWGLFLKSLLASKAITKADIKKVNPLLSSVHQIRHYTRLSNKALDLLTSVLSKVTILRASTSSMMHGLQSAAQLINLFATVVGNSFLRLKNIQGIETKTQKFGETIRVLWKIKMVESLLQRVQKLKSTESITLMAAFLRRESVNPTTSMPARRYLALSASIINSISNHPESLEINAKQTLDVIKQTAALLEEDSQTAANRGRALKEQLERFGKVLQHGRLQFFQTINQMERQRRLIYLKFRLSTPNNILRQMRTDHRAKGFSVKIKEIGTQQKTTVLGESAKLIASSVQLNSESLKIHKTLETQRRCGEAYRQLIYMIKECHLFLGFIPIKCREAIASRLLHVGVQSVERGRIYNLSSNLTTQIYRAWLLIALTRGRFSFESMRKRLNGLRDNMGIAERNFLNSRKAQIRGFLEFVAEIKDRSGVLLGYCHRAMSSMACSSYRLRALMANLSQATLRLEGLQKRKLLFNRLFKLTATYKGIEQLTVKSIRRQEPPVFVYNQRERDQHAIVDSLLDLFKRWKVHLKTKHDVQKTICKVKPLLEKRDQVTRQELLKDYQRLGQRIMADETLLRLAILKIKYEQKRTAIVSLKKIRVEFLEKSKNKETSVETLPPRIDATLPKTIYFPKAYIDVLFQARRNTVASLALIKAMSLNHADDVEIVSQLRSKIIDLEVVILQAYRLLKVKLREDLVPIKDVTAIRETLTAELRLLVGMGNNELELGSPVGVPLSNPPLQVTTMASPEKETIPWCKMASPSSESSETPLFQGYQPKLPPTKMTRRRSTPKSKCYLSY